MIGFKQVGMVLLQFQSKPYPIHAPRMPALSDAGTFLVAERTTCAATMLGLNSSCQLPIALKWQRFENFGIEFTKKVGCLILHRKSYWKHLYCPDIPSFYHPSNRFQYSFEFLKGYFSLYFFLQMTEIFKWTYLSDYCELKRLPQHSSDVFFHGESIFDRFIIVWALCRSIPSVQSQRRLEWMPMRKYFGNPRFAHLHPFGKLPCSGPGRLVVLIGISV